MQMDKQFLNQGKKVSQSTQEHSVYVFLLSGRQSERCHLVLVKKQNPKQNAFSVPAMWIKTAAKNITSSTLSEPLCVLTNHIRPHHHRSLAGTFYLYSSRVSIYSIYLNVKRESAESMRMLDVFSLRRTFAG